MSKSIGNSLRLFVAVYPPEQVARKLLAALDRLRLPAHRLVAPEQVHLTLHFIGDTPVDRLDATRETVHRSTGGLQSFDCNPVSDLTPIHDPVPSLSPAGIALLGGLVLAIAIGGLAVQRRSRAG